MLVQNLISMLRDLHSSTNNNLILEIMALQHLAKQQLTKQQLSNRQLAKRHLA